MTKIKNPSVPWTLTVAAVQLLIAAETATADVFSMPIGQKSLEFVTVGEPGNAADPRVMNDGTSGYGRVHYSYQIGTYDVTSAQYCQFLNAVARTDTYELYSSSMANLNRGRDTGCGILRTGSPGDYSYSVAEGKENFPATCVSWASAARFANWLTNGQPAGPQGLGTTETGSYTLNGAMDTASVMAVRRNPVARYVLPTEDEWYKAAYYKGGTTSSGYWLYPTQSNTAPGNFLWATDHGGANYWSETKYHLYNDGYADPTNFLTAVGTFSGSPGPYGTFDQGGDVWQWNETTISGSYRGRRGGSFYEYEDSLQASTRRRSAPNAIDNLIGFRVALVPEPASLVLLAMCGATILVRRRPTRGGSPPGGCRTLHPPAILGVCVLAACAAPSPAAFSGSDRFDDGSLDSRLWSKTSLEQADLAEAKGRLNFLAPPVHSYNPTPAVEMTWLGGTSTYNEPFDATVDVSAGPLDGPLFTFLGLRVTNTRNTRSFYVRLAYNSDGGWKLDSYGGGSPGGTMLDHGRVSLRLTFGPDRQHLISYYDLDGAANGYSWTSCLAVPASGWSSGAGDTLRLSLFAERAYTYSLETTSLTEDSGFSFDNFRVVPEPVSLLLVAAGWGVVGLRHRRA